MSTAKVWLALTHTFHPTLVFGLKFCAQPHLKIWPENPATNRCLFLLFFFLAVFS
jgi:hypothetical protein